MYFQFSITSMLKVYSETLSKSFQCPIYLQFFKTCTGVRVPLKFAVAEIRVGNGDDDLQFYVLFDNILVISGRWADDIESLCPMEPRLLSRAGLDLRPQNQ